MSLIVRGMIEVDTMLARIDMTTKKRVTEKMYVRAVKIKELAIRFAPIDEGNLEKAIKVRPDTPGRVRDEAGRFARQEIEVYIDMNMPIPGRSGKTVGDYAYEMHEHLTPAGPKKLGPLSEEKNQGSGQVGGAFLTRAMEEAGEGIIAELALNLFGP